MPVAMTSAEKFRESAAHPPRLRTFAGWLPLAILPAGALALRNALPAWGFMWLLAIAIFAGLKWQSWWGARQRVSHPAWRSVAYLLAWPGMDAEAFLDAAAPVLRPGVRDWFAAALKTVLGAILLWGAARATPGNPLMRGWVGMIGLILILHFGSFHLIALFWQWVGLEAHAIMTSPLRSTSLGEFWGKRWNLGFRQLSYDFIFRPLQGRIGAWPVTFLAFLVSGMIHDLVISVPARGGYGLPTAYFALQAFGVGLERSRAGKKLGLRKGVRGWLFMAMCTAGPAFWLFHPRFVLRVIVPFLEAVNGL